MGLEGDYPLCKDKERPQPGELFFLWHDTTLNTFSGYGLITKEGRQDCLAGLLMVDRPRPVDPRWLENIEETYGEYQLVPMTRTGERGILCQMRVAKDSLLYLRFLPYPKSNEIQAALKPLLNEPPNPILKVHWNADLSLWQSEFWIGLPRGDASGV